MGAITVATVEKMVGNIGGRVLDSSVINGLNRELNGVRLTVCSDDEVYSGKPVYACDHYAIYLVGSSDHCMTLTNDYDIATGVVLAEIHPDE